jgi:23S rRNA (cytidine1920-2'-O)/16S rRNA (cytidine1409-2'-O)-methyltransferase
VTRQRLDELLVQRGLYTSRSRARDAIARGTVNVDGVVAAKPAQNTGLDAQIEILDEARAYVSRSALKLKSGITFFNISVKGLNCLDIGASTGGFTQVLLEQGAAHVTAIDVGHGQFDQSLQANPKITSIEGLNARDLTAAHLKHKLDLIVCDVSFISLKLALPAALALADSGTRLLALIKPQFEAGREAVGRGGIVSDPQEHERVCKEISEFLTAENWEVLGLTPSSMEGGDGNKEFLIAAVKL